KIYEIADSELVSPLLNQPVVMKGVAKGGQGWLTASMAWYLNSNLWDVQYAASGPSSWARVSPTSANPPRTSLQPVQVSKIVATDSSVSFNVDTVGVPVLVKVSYFPNWQAHGAQGPFRVAPNLMIVIPTSHHVWLHYGNTPIDWFGYLLGIIGLVALVWMFRAEPVTFAGTRRALGELRVSDGAGWGSGWGPGDYRAGGAGYGWPAGAGWQGGPGSGPDGGWGPGGYGWRPGAPGGPGAPGWRPGGPGPNGGSQIDEAGMAEADARLRDELSAGLGTPPGSSGSSDADLFDEWLGLPTGTHPVVPAGPRSFGAAPPGAAPPGVESRSSRSESPAASTGPEPTGPEPAGPEPAGPEPAGSNRGPGSPLPPPPRPLLTDEASDEDDVVWFAPPGSDRLDDEDQDDDQDGGE
ncbi:MAG: hypothetical protein ACRDZ8_03705, partial [Acidimicrobiales bacterium]